MGRYEAHAGARTHKHMCAYHRGPVHLCVIAILTDVKTCNLCSCILNLARTAVNADLICICIKYSPCVRIVCVYIYIYLWTFIMCTCLILTNIPYSCMRQHFRECMLYIQLYTPTAVCGLHSGTFPSHPSATVFSTWASGMLNSSCQTHLWCRLLL